MRLSQFIEDTLFEIALGVELARARSKDLIAINPSKLDGLDVTERAYIDFDVSIVVSEDRGSRSEGSGKVGGEIKVASIFSVSGEIGGTKESNTTQTTQQAHRVAFKVPVFMAANYANNPATAEAAAILLEKHRPNSSG